MTDVSGCDRLIRMRTIERIVANPSGLHARPAAMFVRQAAAFTSRITLENLDRPSVPVDAKSILMVLGSAVSRGNRIRISADGPDEDDAIEAMGAFVDDGMGEVLTG
jgi:phosphotransferase system HPr (HPr) family protein